MRRGPTAIPEPPTGSGPAAIDPGIAPGEPGQRPTFDAFQAAALQAYAQLAEQPPASLARSGVVNAAVKTQDAGAMSNSVRMAIQ
jgi:hypothetical protein